MDSEARNEEIMEIPLLIPKSENERNKKCWDDTFEEVKRLMILAGPLMSVNVLMNCQQLISIMFVGHLGELSLSGASMATSFASVTGFSLMVGMAGALDTLCGQSYGAKQYKMVGVHMQRAMLVLLLTCIPLAGIWANAGPILRLCGQDGEISDAAGEYARYMIPCIFPYAILECQIRFLQAQNNVVPTMFTAGMANLVHVLSCWILVFKSGMGFKGAAVANAVSYWMNVLLLGVYVRVSPSCKETWKGFSMDVFGDIGKFLRLGIPSALMLCLEIWSFELMVLLSGLLPNPTLETSVLSITLNISTTLYMLPMGLGGAISIRVSNELGGGRANAAWMAVRSALWCVAIEGILVAITMASLHTVLGYCFTAEENVVKYVGKMLLLLSGSHFIDGLESILSGTAIGCGWQKTVAMINLGAYSLLGIPAGILLAFVFRFGGKGLWLGIIIALFAKAVLLFIITLRTNWENEAKKAADRVHETIHDLTIRDESCNFKHINRESNLYTDGMPMNFENLPFGLHVFDFPPDNCFSPLLAANSCGMYGYL